MLRAIKINPGYAVARYWYVTYLAAMGRQEEALAESHRALELEPLSLVINAVLGFACYYARRYDAAIEHYRRIIEMDPSFFPAHLLLGSAYAQKGEWALAVVEFQEAGQLDDTPWPLAKLGQTYALSGQREEAQNVLQELHALAGQRYVSAFDVALIHAALGEKDRAFEWLNKAFEERSSWLVFTKVEPGLDGLHGDPRFQELVQRVGLP